MYEQFIFRLCISVLIPIYSGLPGLWIAQIMRKTNASLFDSVKNFQVTNNVGFYKLLGLNLFTYCIKNTFFRHCNTKIKITKKPSIEEADKLLNEITISELCHLFGFIFVVLFQITAILLGFYGMFFSSILFNTIFNVYPILLQERNKLRIRNFLEVLQH